MQHTIVVIVTFLLSGCGGLDMLNRVDFLGGVGEAPTLSPYPTRGCLSSDCAQLDEVEAHGYERARNGQITWVNFVNTFYRERSRLFPNSSESESNREYRAYQFVLAEQLDSKRITEADWVYQLEKKRGRVERKKSRVRKQQEETSKLRDTESRRCPIREISNSLRMMKFDPARRL